MTNEKQRAYFLFGQKGSFFARRAFSRIRRAVFIFQTEQVSNMPVVRRHGPSKTKSLRPPRPTPLPPVDEDPSEVDIEEDEEMLSEGALAAAGGGIDLGDEDSSERSDEGDSLGPSESDESDMGGQPPKRRKLAHSRVRGNVERQSRKRKAASAPPSRRTTSSGPRTTQWCYTLNNPGKNTTVLSYMREVHINPVTYPGTILWDRREVNVGDEYHPLTRSKARGLAYLDCFLCDIDRPDFKGYSVPHK